MLPAIRGCCKPDLSSLDPAPENWAKRAVRPVETYLPELPVVVSLLRKFSAAMHVTSNQRGLVKELARTTQPVDRAGPMPRAWQKGRRNGRLSAFGWDQPAQPAPTTLHSPSSQHTATSTKFRLPSPSPTTAADAQMASRGVRALLLDIGGSTAPRLPLSLALPRNV